MVHRDFRGFVFVQPALEPWPSGVVKIGPLALFFYVRWSFFGVGFDVLKAGFALHFGPLMVGFAHIKKQIAAFDAERPTP